MIRSEGKASEETKFGQKEKRQSVISHYCVANCYIGSKKTLACPQAQFKRFVKKNSQFVVKLQKVLNLKLKFVTTMHSFASYG